MFDVLIPAGVRDVDLASLRFFGVDRALALDEGSAVDGAPALIERLTALCTLHVTRLRAAGIEATAAVGVTPTLDPRHWEAALRAVPTLLLRDEVSTVGPLRLTESRAEGEEALVAEQLSLCRQLRRRALLMASSPRALRRLLALAQAARLHRQRVVVLGVRPSTVKLVIGRGHAGIIVVKPDGVTADEAVSCVRAVGPAGLMFASMAGTPSAELLAAPRALARLASSGVTGAVVRSIATRNATLAFPSAVGPVH